MNRLDKLVAHRAGMTRKEAAAAVRRGRVTVDGEVVRDPGRRTSGAVALDDHPLEPPPRLAVFHKPSGVQSTVGDPWGRASLVEVAREPLALGLHPVGRLDADTTGLLLFSADGALTQRLLHPRHAVRKVYVATVESAPDDHLRARLTEGVATAEGVHTAEVLALEGHRVTLAVTEGKHRMVRRMLANAGFPVRALHRIAMGEVTLGDLAEGTWRPASEAELRWVQAIAGR